LLASKITVIPDGPQGRPATQARCAPLLGHGSPTRLRGRAAGM